MVLVLVKREYFVFLTPEFCYIVCAGSIVSYISVILLLPDNLQNGDCYAHLWAFGIGFWLVYVGIFLKNFRLFYVFAGAEKLVIRKLTYREMLIPLFLCCCLEAIFQICWDAIPAVRPNMDRSDDDENKIFVLYCGGNRWMWLGSVLVRIFILGCSSFLAYYSRKLKKETNYSREIALTIYSSFIILAIAIPIGFSINQSPLLVVLLKGISILLAYNCVIIIIYWDSLARIVLSDEPRVFVSTGVSSGAYSDGSTGTLSGMSGSSSVGLDVISHHSRI